MVKMCYYEDRRSMFSPLSLSKGFPGFLMYVVTVYKVSEGFRYRSRTRWWQRLGPVPEGLYFLEHPGIAIGPHWHVREYMHRPTSTKS